MSRARLGKRRTGITLGLRIQPRQAVDELLTIGGEASARTASMNRFTLALVAPAVSVCGMISSASAMTVSFCAGVSALGAQAAACAAAAW